MTVAVMASFGADGGAAGDGWRVEGSGYTGRTYAVEPDASTACYFLAAAAITGGRVRIDGLGAGSIQGDAGFVDVLDRTWAARSCRARITSSSSRHRRPRRDVDVDLSDISDQAPTFAAVAAFAELAELGAPASASSGGRRPTASAGRSSACAASASTPRSSTTGSPIRPVDPARGAARDLRRPPHGHELRASSGCGSPASRSRIRPCVAKTFPGFLDALDSLTTADVTS